MKSTILTFIYILISFLFVVGGVGCSSPLFDKEIESTETHLFYSIDSSIYAIDPDSPLKSIFVASDVVAPQRISYTYRFNDAINTSMWVTPAIVYAKNGNIWGINAIKGEKLRRSQLSNEQFAYDICYVGSDTAESIFDARYSYTLPGKDNLCATSYEASDDETKMVTLGMEKTSDPISNIRGEVVNLSDSD